MGQNSFLLKGWCITLIAALFALSTGSSNKSFALIAYLPLFLFWLMDAYYLSLERSYIQLYNLVARGEIESNELTLDLSKIESSESMINAALSKTLVVFYGTVISIVLFLMFWVLN
ncbi:hypothetical protein BA746_10380 [Vibrio parahaemolyticus]|nr:hypothetical protein ACX04_05665 [Vibrio parahaemolyticus]ODW90223.1 hypothetical protein BBM90_19085 [Vibrio parahaemolyticus]ODX44374.1 hypothetical protein BBM06_17735 [Vibrio parahaemolyticus]ODX65663.1 hypothetical protein BBM08_00005 [Vibrio parahaemolyticus]ODX66491.1 hypothetical protein BBM07_00010 [Vibrio parahaemolyticus]